MLKKNNFGFPIHYGDTPSTEGDGLNNKVVTIVLTFTILK